MNRTWAETQMQLDMLRYEHTTICQELYTTVDPEHAKYLAAMASACVLEYIAVLRQHREAYTAQIAARRAAITEQRRS
jgi:hypothetical protein